MGYIVMFLAWLQMQGSQLADHAWSYAYWTKVLAMTTGLYNFTWTIWWIALIVGFAYGFIAIARGVPLKDLMGCFGCIAVILLILPFGAWLNLKEAQGIVNSISADGIVNATNFWVSLFLYLFVGIF